jgi:predicted RNA-binding protein with RPS1 domain
VASSSTSACAASCPPPSSRCVASATCSRTSASRSRPRSSSWTRTATTWSCPAAPGSSRPSPRSARPSSRSCRRARSAPVSCPHRQLRCVRRPRRRRRSRPRLRAVLEAHRPPERGRRGRHEVTVEVLDVDMDRERVSLSLKATQEDPWQHFARTHAIGQVVPGKVTKLVPFGAFVRVDDGIEGLVHISELAERHVELPEQVVTVGEDIFVKVIDIDLERRRISLSLKQANDGRSPTPSSTRRSTAWPPSTTSRATTSTPRASTRDQRVAAGLRGAAREVGEAVRRGTRPLGGPQGAGRGGRQGRLRGCGRGGRRPLVLLLLGCDRRRPPARSPPTRPWPRCARSSPATEHGIPALL